MSRSAVQRKYTSTEPGVRAHFGENQNEAQNYYSKYVSFIRENAGAGNSTLLEIGCGSGWSTRMLKDQGFQVQGIDMHPGPLEAGRDISYIQGDSQNLPFPDESFEVITMHDVLEHVPSPEKALNECWRVLKPGGRLIIVGPNLLSFLSNIYFTLIVTWQKAKQGKLFEKRDPQMPNHPGGNTVFEAWYFTFHHLFHTLKKLIFEREVQFLLRDPDPNPPFFADNDACYYLNPVDLVRWSKSQKNSRLIKCFSSHRSLSKYIWPFLGGTWVVIEKNKPGSRLSSNKLIPKCLCS